MLLISTAKHSLDELLEVKGHVDGYELGIGLIEHNRKLCGILHGSIRTIHNLPALMPEEKGFMMEPAVNPEPAAEMATKMVKRVEGMLSSWEVYGVHAGLRGQIKSSTDFTVKGGLLPFEKCLENIRVFCDMMRGVVPPEKLAVENIYGADEQSLAVGADEGELRLLSKVTPLLLDIGHLAVNCAYKKNPLESLNLKGLRVAELHVGFLHPKINNFTPENLKATPMFWDHHPYTDTYVNRQILNMAFQLTKKTMPVVVEVSGTLEEMKRTLEKLSFARDR